MRLIGWWASPVCIRIWSGRSSLPENSPGSDYDFCQRLHKPIITNILLFGLKRHQFFRLAGSGLSWFGLELLHIVSAYLLEIGGFLLGAHGGVLWQIGSEALQILLLLLIPIDIFITQSFDIEMVLSLKNMELLKHNCLQLICHPRAFFSCLLLGTQFLFLKFLTFCSGYHKKLN